MMEKNKVKERGSKRLSDMKANQMLLQDRWNLLRGKISYCICALLLLASQGLCGYVLLNAGSFSYEVRISITSIIYLSQFAFLGFVTNNPPILKAVASAIINFAFKQPKKDDDD
jgi:hypothetical protein